MSLEYQPPMPTGSGREAVFQQSTKKRLDALTFKSSPTVTANRTTKGIYFTARGGGGQGATAKIYAITQLYGVPSAIGLPGIDYIGVTPWDPAANDGDGGTTGSQIIIAKSIDGRQPGFESIDTSLINYTYTDDNHRVATPEILGSVENQVMHKRYMVWPNAPPDESMVDNNQIIVYVQKINGGTGVLDMNGNQLQYAEVNPNREWALAAS